MSGTELAYAATRRWSSDGVGEPVLEAWMGTVQPYRASRCPVSCYAISGIVLRDVRRATQSPVLIRCDGRPTLCRRVCPVLTEAMLLPGAGPMCLAYSADGLVLSYACAMRCPVLTRRMRVPVGSSGFEERGSTATPGQSNSAMSGSECVSSHKWYRLGGYMPTQCPVLTCSVAYAMPTVLT
eukprot:2461482-Rhodomonas_salina.4